MTDDRAAAARAFLRAVNLDDYAAAVNPAGLCNDGHSVNLEPMLHAVADSGEHGTEKWPRPRRAQLATRRWRRPQG